MPTTPTIRLENTSAEPLSGWAVCTVPAALAASLPIECVVLAPGGRKFRAVRGSTTGQKTVFRVFAELAGLELCAGGLWPRPADMAPPPPFTPHAWTVDAPEKLAPRLRIQVANGLTTSIVNASGAPVVELVAESPAHRRFRMRAHYHGAGCWFWWWADMLHNDPVLHVVGALVWSDRGVAVPARTLAAVEFRSGEAVVWDAAGARGITSPVGDPDNGYASLLLSKPVTFQDGAGFGFSGRMLSFRDPSRMAEAWTPADEAALAMVRAAAGGRIYAVCEDWNGRWLAGKATPEPLTEHDREMARLDVHYALRGMSLGNTIATRRHEGCGPEPSATGEQEDFGATKGSAAVSSGLPSAFILYQLAGYAELLRGRNHFDPAGNRLRAAQLLDWVTWSGETHYSPNISPNRLGKLSTAVRVGTGHIPHDDQHMSLNNLGAALALSDDPLLDFIAEGIAECERASYAVRFNCNDRSYRPPDADAARAQGRTVQALAQLASVVPPAIRETLDFCRTARLSATTRTPTLNVLGPIRPLAAGAPDNRKNVWNPDGTRASWVSCWEHGLAMIGFAAGAPTPLAEKVATFLAEWAIHEGPAGWVVLDDFAWHNGEPPPQGFLGGGEKPAAVVRPLVARLDEPEVGGVAAWTIAGLVAARPFLRGALAEKVGRFLAALSAVSAAAGDAAPSRMRNEWWAVPR